MVLLCCEDVPKMLDSCRAWVLDGVNRGTECRQGDYVQRDMMESLPNVHDSVSSVTELFLYDIQKLGSLGPKGWRQVLDMFELESWLKNFAIDLCCSVSQMIILECYKGLIRGASWEVIQECLEDQTGP